MAGKSSLPHVIFAIQNEKYAVSSEYVLHIEVLGEVTPMVDAAPHCRGVVLFHGESIPVFDLRSMFSVSDYADELREFMAMRIRDHEEWVEALEAYVEEGVPFTKTTNPHQCAFGKWFDSFETDNSYLTMHLRNVDKPHKDIHKTGETVLHLMKEGRQDEARQAVQEMKATSFAKTKEILSGAADVYIEGAREMLVVLNTGGPNDKGIVVDRIIAIKHLDTMCGVPQVHNNSNQYIENIAVDEDAQGDKDLILLLDATVLGEC